MNNVKTAVHFFTGNGQWNKWKILSSKGKKKNCLNSYAIREHLVNRF